MRRCLGLCLAIACALLAGTIPVYAARDLEDYDYEDYASSTEDDSYINYYPNGVVYDDSGVVHTSGGTVRMEVGETLDLAEGRIYHSTATYDDDKTMVIQSGPKTWASKDSAVASVDAKGVVTAHKRGSTRITVSWTDNRGYRVTQTIRLRVTDGTARAASVGNTLELADGSRVYLGGLVFDRAEGETITWASSKEKIAQVDADGLVTAGSIGSCTVTASYVDAGGVQRTETFSIRVTSMLLEDRERSIQITVPTGESVDLLRLLYPSSYNSTSFARNIEATAANASVARIEGSVVEAVASGSCTVTVKQYDGYEVVKTQKVLVVSTL